MSAVSRLRAGVNPEESGIKRPCFDALPRPSYGGLCSATCSRRGSITRVRAPGSMSSPAASGRGEEVIDLARTNLWR